MPYLLDIMTTLAALPATPQKSVQEQRSVECLIDEKHALYLAEASPVTVQGLFAIAPLSPFPQKQKSLTQRALSLGVEMYRLKAGSIVCRQDKRQMMLLKYFPCVTRDIQTGQNILSDFIAKGIYIKNRLNVTAMHSMETAGTSCVVEI